MTHAEEYWEDFIDEEDNSYFFYFQAPKGTNLKSFLCLISLEDNTFNVIEAFRKSNEPLSINDQFNLTSFLSSEGIALLPKDVFIVSFGIDFLYQLSSISPDKIIEFISTNKDLFEAFNMLENLSLSNKNILGKVLIEDLIDKKTGNLQTHTLRYWESQFRQVKPIIRAFNSQSGKKFLSATHQLIIDRELIFISELEKEAAVIKIDKTDLEILHPLRINCSISEDNKIVKNSIFG